MILKIEGNFEGEPQQIFQALGKLAATFASESFEKLKQIKPLVVMMTSKELEELASNAVLGKNLRDIEGLNQAIIYRLGRVGINTVGDVVSKRKYDLLAVPNIGKKFYKELEDKMGELGLIIRQ